MESTTTTHLPQSALVPQEPTGARAFVHIRRNADIDTLRNANYSVDTTALLVCTLNET